MAFKHTDYITRFLTNPGQNDATAYGVTIKPANVQPGQIYWRCIGVHHLTGPENAGKNHIFLDALDEEGRRIAPVWPLVDWKWVGMQDHQKPGVVVLDKPSNEPGGNIGLHSKQIVTVWVAGRDSDEVSGLQTAGVEGLPEEAGNHRYHNSFYVVFQRTVAGGEAEPEEPPEEEEPEEPTPGPVEGFTKFIPLFEDEKLEVKLMITVKGQE